MSRCEHFKSDKDMWQFVVREIAEFHSNCNSRKIGCIIIDKNGIPISNGSNVTGNIYCEFVGCYKRKMGDSVGHSKYCEASHAEETASKLLVMKMNEDSKIRDGKPFTAIMNCGYPCRYCLAALDSAEVTKLVLNCDTFYTEEDKKAWIEKYSKKMSVEIIKQEGDEESAKHTTIRTS